MFFQLPFLLSSQNFEYAKKNILNKMVNIAWEQKFQTPFFSHGRAADGLQPKFTHQKLKTACAALTPVTDQVVTRVYDFNCAEQQGDFGR